MSSEASPPNGVLQFRIELINIEPLIWRRIQVPDLYSFWDLHIAIQNAFGWNDSHLHEFEIPAGKKMAVQRFGMPMDEDPDPKLRPDWKYRVVDHLSIHFSEAKYTYDFGDDWEHKLQLEDIVAPSPGKKYPRCVAGERSGPPDDCGGPWGYQELLKVLADPKHPEHKRLSVWATSIKGVKGKFDPEAFDEQSVKFENPTRRLKQLLDQMRAG